MEATLKEEGDSLNYEIARFYTDLEGNDLAKKLIIDTLNRDVKELKEREKSISLALRAIKEKR